MAKILVTQFAKKLVTQFAKKLVTQFAKKLVTQWLTKILVNIHRDQNFGKTIYLNSFGLDNGKTKKGRYNNKS